MDALSALRHDQQPAPPILDLLRSFGIGDPNVLCALAARLPAAADSDDPTRAARTVLGQWFAPLLDRPDVDVEDAFLLGRAVFVALGGAGRWPRALLTEEAPEELCAKLRRGLPLPCPDAAQTVMIIQSLDPPSPLTGFAAWFRGRPRPVHPA
ncbi:MAG: hypothetical protein ACREEV_15925 [Dongiaceae bacterium]